MGLINRYKEDLVGKTFFYYSCREFDPQPVWFIGKIIEIHPALLAHLVTFAIYMPLAQSANWWDMDVPDRYPDSFDKDSNMDKESRLITSSFQFEEYLRLFDGTD